MADHLPSLFEEAGLADVTVSVEDEVAEAGDAGLPPRSACGAT